MADARTEIIAASVKGVIIDLRRREHNCLTSYETPHMKEMADFLAETYDEAACLLARRLAEWKREYASTPPLGSSDAE